MTDEIDQATGEEGRPPEGGLPGECAAPVASVPAGPKQSPLPPVAAAARGFAARFALVYLGLGAMLTAAMAGLVFLAHQPSPPSAAAWSSWRPSTGNVSKASQEIADHVARDYHLDAKGSQLVAVLPSVPELTRNTKVSRVSTIAIRPTAQSKTFSRVFDAGGAYQDQFCGLGDYCAVKGGTPSATRERLIRREALEVALYTFRYLPQVSSLIAFIPPPPGQPPSTILFLERSDFQSELSQPLTKTLPLANPPLPDTADTVEAAKIDRLTLPLRYTFQYEALADGTLALILAPSSV